MFMRLTVLVPLIALFAGAAVAQETGVSRSSNGELALSNDTLQLGYIGSGQLVGVERSRLSGTFFLSEERDIVLSAGLLFPADLDLGR